MKTSHSSEDCINLSKEDSTVQKNICNNSTMMLLTMTVTHSTARCCIDLCDCCSTVTPVFPLAVGPWSKDRTHS